MIFEYRISCCCYCCRRVFSTFLCPTFFTSFKTFTYDFIYLYVLPFHSSHFIYFCTSNLPIYAYSPFSLPIYTLTFTFPRSPTILILVFFGIAGICLCKNLYLKLTNAPRGHNVVCYWFISWWEGCRKGSSRVAKTMEKKKGFSENCENDKSLVLTAKRP